MLGRLASDDVLQRMLTVRASYLQKTKLPERQLVINEGINDLLGLVNQNHFPQQFQEMTNKLDKTYQLFQRAENELAILKTLKSAYENSINGEESETLQKEKFQIMLNFTSNTFSETREELSSMLPVPKFKAFKSKIQNRIVELNKINSNALDHSLLTLYENEKQVNSYLASKVDEILTLLSSFKERYQQFELDANIVASLILPLIDASVAHDIKKVKHLHDELIAKIKNDAANSLKQAYLVMEEYHELS